MIEALFSALIDIVLIKIFYWPGWVMLRGITFGHYPPAAEKPHNHEFVASIGLVSILAVIFVVATA